MKLICGFGDQAVPSMLASDQKRPSLPAVSKFGKILYEMTAEPLKNDKTIPDHPATKPDLDGLGNRRRTGPELGAAA